MKKNITMMKIVLVMGILACILYNSGFHSSMINTTKTIKNQVLVDKTAASYTKNNNITSQNGETQYQKLSDYMRTVYTTSTHPEWDEIIYNGMDLFEENKENPERIYFFSSTNENESYQIRYYLTGRYGYTIDMEIVLAKINNGESYKLAFRNSQNANEKIREYKEEVKKAQAISATLQGYTKDDTIENTVNWIYKNVEYNWDYKNLSRAIEGYFGAYSGESVICGGFACITVQLLNMNGVNCEVVTGIEDGGGHMWNKVETSDGWIWYDTENKMKSASLWRGYELDSCYY